MIKSITVTNHLGESIKLELGRPEKSGFLVQRIEGLGPSKANINSTELATNDGSLFNSARATSRNIVMSLKFLWDPTIEDVRHRSYKYFPVKKPITLLVETDNRTCVTYGHVESNEPDIFSSEEGCQISILCPDPYFYSIDKQVTVFSGTDPLFEFPYSNEGTTNITEFGAIRTDTLQNIVYDGDADIGVVMIIHAIGAVSNITIYDTDTRRAMKINTTLAAGDDIIVSTIKGDKYVTALKAGIYSNILNSVEKGAEWFQLTKGNNVFAYTAASGADNIEFRVENLLVYEGV